MYERQLAALSKQHLRLIISKELHSASGMWPRSRGTLTSPRSWPRAHVNNNNVLLASWTSNICSVMRGLSWGPTMQNCPRWMFQNWRFKFKLIQAVINWYFYMLVLAVCRFLQMQKQLVKVWLLSPDSFWLWLVLHCYLSCISITVYYSQY